MRNVNYTGSSFHYLAQGASELIEQKGRACRRKDLFFWTWSVAITEVQ